MRTRYSFVNAIVSLFSQLINIVITFVSRRVFLLMLGETALGVNSLFTQIMSMLSLVELGIGSAIVFSLYKPLAEDDKEQVSAIMELYRRIYTCIGAVVMLLGIVLTPFVRFFITGDISDVKHLHLIFIMFTLNSALTYFNSYKQNLIIADQKKYITLIYHYVLYVFMNVIQIVLLICTRDFILYLMTQIIFTVLENIILSYKTQKLYPYLGEFKNVKVKKATLDHMKKNVKALICHRVGGICVSSTDALIISKFIGIVTVAKYTNYIYVTNAFSTLISQVFSSFTSSIGNYNAESSKEDTYQIFKKVLFLNFFIYAIVAVSTFCLINDFIAVVFGRNMVLSWGVVFLLVLRFYMSGMRATLLTFKDALGIYYPDRYRPLLEGFVNLLVSILLAPRLGLAGVILGTIISHMIANMWIEPYVVYRDGFDMKVSDFYKKYIRYFIQMFLIGGVIYWLSRYIVVTSFLEFVFKGFFVLIIAGLLTLGVSCLFGREELKYYLGLIKKIKTGGDET